LAGGDFVYQLIHSNFSSSGKWLWREVLCTNGEIRLSANAPPLAPQVKPINIRSGGPLYSSS